MIGDPSTVRDFTREVPQGLPWSGVMGRHQHMKNLDGHLEKHKIKRKAWYETTDRTEYLHAIITEVTDIIKGAQSLKYPCLGNFLSHCE